MKTFYFTLAAFFIAWPCVIARADNPAASVAEPPKTEMPNPAGHAPVVEMPLKGNEPMSTGMKKPGMKKEDVKTDYMKKEQMIDELMEKGETKK